MDLPEQSERIIAHFGLKFDPFGSLVDSMVFSGACGRYEIVENVRHLLSYSPQDGLITGAPGSGKRMVSQQVIKLLEDEWRVCWIDGSDTDTPDMLFKEIVGQLGLGIKLDGVAPNSVKKIVDVCAARIEAEESFLILVQFADRLPTVVAETLMQIREQSQSPHSRVRQIWLCDSLEALPIDVFDDDWYHQPLKNFDDAAAEQYLKDRFVAAGHIGELPVPTKDVARLNHMAKGLPQKLNSLVTDYLMSATFKTTQKQQGFPITHLIAGVAALSLVVIAFLYQTSESTPAEEVVAPANPVPSAIEQKLAAAVAEVEAKQTSENSSDAEQSTAVELESSSPSETQNPAVTQSPATNSATSNENTVAPVETEIIAEGVPVESNTPAPKPQSRRLLTRGSDNEFTVQLIGVRDRAKLDPLIAKFNDQSNIDVVETAYQGQPWYVLIYGQFESRSSAQGASSALPSDFSGQELWIRSFASVRQDAQ